MSPFSFRTWGASAEDVAARYPCDDLDFAHDDVFFRAVDVAAPRPLVFRWLRQLRIAPYSHDWLDNFGRPSPAQLSCVATELAPGQRIMHVFRLIAFEPDASLTIALATRWGRALMGDFAGSYVVRDAAGATRLVAKILVRYPRGPYGALLRRAMPPLDLFMFRKQLLTLRAYAERDAAGDRLDF